MTELREKLNNIVEDYNECTVLAKSIGSTEVYEGTTATAEDIALGKTAYSNGKKITGRMSVSNTHNATMSTINTANFSKFMISNVLDKIDLKDVDTSVFPSFSQAFQYFIVSEVLNVDTSKSTDMSYMFQGCRFLETVSLLDCGLCRNVTSMFQNDSNLKNLGGFKDLGKAYVTTTANLAAYRLDLSACTLLTHESLMNVINNLYDLNLSYNVAGGGTLYRQRVILSAKSKELLSEEEIAIATNKGWDIL